MIKRTKEIFDNFTGGMFVGFFLTMLMTAILFGYGSIPVASIRTGMLYVDDRAFKITELK